MERQGHPIVWEYKIRATDCNISDQTKLLTEIGKILRDRRENKIEHGKTTGI